MPVGNMDTQRVQAPTLVIRGTFLMQQVTVSD